uniref:Uncharacterized protein n=1 Tax=Arundo donax TaxID=35708 RepID=A0A0A9GRP5_ARUDO
MSIFPNFSHKTINGVTQLEINLNIITCIMVQEVINRVFILIIPLQVINSVSILSCEARLASLIHYQLFSYIQLLCCSLDELSIRKKMKMRI